MEVRVFSAAPNTLHDEDDGFRETKNGRHPAHQTDGCKASRCLRPGVLTLVHLDYFLHLEQRLIQPLR
ncbi:MAG: hypothetical protein AAFR21_19255, partial [Pseudomonadota bacterium]